MMTNQNSEASQELVYSFENALVDSNFDLMTRLLYSTDASIYQMLPIGVVFPKNADEIALAIEMAKQFDIPVLPRGGGSSLAGQAIGNALILDLSRYMNEVLDINIRRKSICVQSGVNLGVINKYIAKHNLTFGPDPASADRATVGGILGNNSTGTHSIVYGMAADHVLNTNVVLSNGRQARFDNFVEEKWNDLGKRANLEGNIYRGVYRLLKKYEKEIISNYPKTFRHVAGYNLHKFIDSKNLNLSDLVIGSEGTLGVITRATLNLVQIPTVTCLCIVHFSNLNAAMEAVPYILETKPTAIEVLDKMMLDLIRGRKKYQNILGFIEGNPETVLLVEYAGDTEININRGIEQLKVMRRRIHHTDPLVIISDPEKQANVWHIRKLGLGILMSIRGDAKPIPFIEDAAVPVEYLSDYVGEITDFSYDIGAGRVAMYGHASAGCAECVNDFGQLNSEFTE